MERRIASWTHLSAARGLHWVYPDGCRDVLVHGDGRVGLTGLDLGPRAVVLGAGARIAGVRMRPGAVVDRDVLAAVAARPGAAALIVSEALGAPGEIECAIAALGAGAGPRRVAQALGVTPRTLQRRLAALGLPPPGVWHGLGRARRAAAMLDAPLAEVAAAAGFADQAHMTREIRRWFGTSPAAVRRDPALRAALAYPGLGGWTGVQSSTRIPFGSAT